MGVQIAKSTRLVNENDEIKKRISYNFANKTVFEYETEW